MSRGTHVRQTSLSPGRAGSMTALPALQRTRRIQRGPMVVLALLPFLAFTLALVAAPLAQVIRMSLSHIDLKASGFSYEWSGLDNYIEVLSAGQTWQAIWNTFVFVLATVTGSILVGLVAALLVNRAVYLLPVAR